MSALRGPCKDCGEREPGCHAKCEKYKAFRVERDAFNARKREESIRSVTGWNHYLESKRLFWRKKG